MNRRPCIVGIDPGLDGAIAVYSPWENSLKNVFDIPVDKIQKGRMTKRTVNVVQMAGIMRCIQKEFAIAMIAIEKVHSSPQMGVASAFSFGWTAGVIYAVCETLFTEPLVMIEPQMWKRRVFCGGRNSDHSGLGRTKDDSLTRAKLLFGDVEWFARKGDHGRAEAALIAWYAAKTYQPEKELDPLS